MRRVVRAGGRDQPQLSVVGPALPFVGGRFPNVSPRLTVIAEKFAAFPRPVTRRGARKIRPVRAGEPVGDLVAVRLRCGSALARKGVLVSIGVAAPVLGESIAVIGQTVPLIGERVALVGQSFAFTSHLLAVVGATLCIRGHK